LGCPCSAADECHVEAATVGRSRYERRLMALAVELGHSVQSVSERFDVSEEFVRQAVKDCGSEGGTDRCQPWTIHCHKN
jgi:transposase-like protein